MTSPAEGGPKARSRGLVVAALILSLLLNLMFIGGLVWLRSVAERAGGPGERFVHAARELNLSVEQKEAFAQFRLDLQRLNRTLRQKNRPVLEGYFDEIGKQPPNQEAISRLVDEADANRHLFQKDLTASLSRFMSMLTPEQRSRFVAEMKRPPDQRGARIRRWFLP